MTWKSEVESLIIFGKLNDINSDPLNILKVSANKDPELLLNLIIEAIDNNVDHMVIPALAAFLCNANKEIFNIKLNSQLIQLLESYKPSDLLMLTELIKSKVFGRGLGSKSQKIIRSVLEKWSETDLKNNILLDSKSVYALVRLIHPRYKGAKATVIKNLLK